MLLLFLNFQSDLSNWCIFHRKKAKQVVETWDKLFKSSQKEKRVSFLYLANDILQNSKRKGSEFVNEFWRVLPAALKHVFENGDDNGKKAVFRLVDIWEERKVFGSRGQSLKDEMLGKDPPPVLENNGRSLNSIKIVKKDAHSIRIKLAVGGTPEKIVTAFQSVNDEHVNEETALSKCKAAVDRVEEMEKDIGYANAQGNQQLSSLGEVQEQENVLRKCVEQLKSVEATRESLLTQLKEALKDQESKLELIRTQLQVAQARIDQASNVRQRLGSAPVPAPSPPATTTLPAETSMVETNPPPIQTTSSFSLPPPLPQPVTSFSTPTTAEEENKKAAAAVAAKLAASTSSAQMLSAVLSSLAAEEAASINNGLKSSGSMSLPIFPPEKRPRLETPMPVSDMSNTAYYANAHQQPLPNLLPTSTNAQMQPPFPPPPPLPPVPPPPLQPYTQSNNVIAGAMPFRYGANKGLPPPPPLPTHFLGSDSLGIPPG
ncbi:CID domain [Macleaya cordata]|uniref:CID domain n=1 Tax=Macleaya cordata TaxID=56857 RepID=A0A200Q072_MACCD|nr:CID domain [Macleaya cordata]